MSELTVPQALQLAVQHQQAGRLSDAQAIYRQVLDSEPQNADALYLLGMIAQQVGRHEDAVELFRAGIRVRPRHAGLRMGLGISLALGGKDLEIALHELRHAALIDPAAPDIHLNLGNVLNLTGRRDEAIAAFRRALAINDDFAEARFNLANALLDLSLDDAIAEFEKLKTQRPDLPIVYKHLADALVRRGYVEPAMQNLRRASELDPALPEPHFDLGVLLLESGRREEAIVRYREAIRLNPDYAAAHHNLAIALNNSAPAEELIDHFRQVLRIEPGQREAADNVLHLLHYLPDAQPGEIVQEHLIWAQLFEKPLLIEPPLFDQAFDRDPDRRLRIGFVSREFRQHSVACFLEPILRSLDRERFGVFLYADEFIVDPVTERLRRLADGYKTITGLDDAQAAALIAADRVDILIELAGHTTGNRLLALARRPAPLQLTWLGYPGTTAMETIDYSLTDALADPSGDPDRMYTEKLLRLETARCYYPPDDAPDVASDLPSDGAGHVTFGCFNVLPKVNPPLIAEWARLLKAVPNARLILKSRGLERNEAARRIQGILAAQGIRPSRVDLLPWTPSFEAHLDLYNRVDVALDTFPCHGVATTCEALWMGVPVVTLAGRTRASRAGVSLLDSAGLRDCIADDFGQYTALAAELATDETRRRALRSGLRGQLRNSALLDAPGAARRFESALRDIWRQRVHS